MNCPKGALAGNLAAHRATLTDAAALGADLVVFPEFSLTGSVDPVANPHHLIPLEHPVVDALVGATAEVGAVFGLAERDGDGRFITQVAACDGALAAVQRKRHLGQDEDSYSTGSATTVFRVADRTCGMVICAEAGVDWTWDACVRAGADVIFLCAAPGLYGRRTDADSWRAGLDWWQGSGLRDARRQAQRLSVWVAMSTQAGSTTDEDFPGLAALISPSGEVLEQATDWRQGRLLAEIPLRW